MTAAPDIVVDPYLLCLPNPCHSIDQLDEFIDGLLSWSDSLRRADIGVYISDECMLSMVEDNLYPYQYKLRDMLRAFEIDHVDHETVCRVAQHILEHTQKVEDLTGISDVLCEETGLSIKPWGVIERLSDLTGSAFKKCLVILALKYKGDASLSECCVIASTPVRNDAENATMLSVTAEVHDIEWNKPPTKIETDFPLSLSGVFDLYYNFNAILGLLGCVHLWSGADSDQGARDAINQMVHQLVESGASEPSSAKAFQLGSQFLETARIMGFGSRTDHAMVLIESCARIIIDQPKNAIKPFRINANPNADQQERDDGARAFRTHLTKRGAGFRLMLWIARGGDIEFANVGPKNELVIY